MGLLIVWRASSDRLLERAGEQTILVANQILSLIDWSRLFQFALENFRRLPTIPKRASPGSLLTGREESSGCLRAEAALLPGDSNCFHLEMTSGEISHDFSQHEVL